MWRSSGTITVGPVTVTTAPNSAAVGHGRPGDRVGEPGGGDAGDRDPDRQQVAHRRPDLAQVARVERQPALEQDDRDPEVDEDLEPVPERARVEQPEPLRPGGHAEQQQRHDRRQPEALRQHLGEDAEKDGGDDRLEDQVLGVGLHGAKRTASGAEGSGGACGGVGSRPGGNPGAARALYG
jgi:hypothetical protein